MQRCVRIHSILGWSGQWMHGGHDCEEEIVTRSSLFGSFGRLLADWLVAADGNLLSN